MEFRLVFIFIVISAFLQMNLVTSDYVLPVPGDCTKYQVCDYSGCFIFNCGIGTEFNPRILVCDYPLRDRGACGIRDYNIGPTIPYPGRAINYPSYQQPTNGYPAPNNGYPAPNSGYPTPSSGYPAPNSGYPTPNSGYPPANNPGYYGYPGSGSQNPTSPAQGCPAGCG